MTIRIVDCETTGETPPEHKVVELASCDLDPQSGQFQAPRSELVNPGRPIPPDSRGIHHISDAMVANARDIDVVAKNVLLPYPFPTMPAFAAHNAKFEQSFLAQYTGDVPWICTFKVALRLWPDAPNHKNQTLRYFLNIQMPEKVESMSYPPHRALPDAIVTGHILREALNQATIEQMIAWSKEPPLLPRLTFGKHRGEEWNVVPADYLVWIVEKSELDDDAKWNAKRELQRRTRESTIKQREAYLYGVLKAAIPLARCFSDLAQWFRDETKTREQYGIFVGTPEYDEIVKACAAKKASLPPEPTNANVPANPGADRAA
jgi:exodeoxyribonuclease X